MMLLSGDGVQDVTMPQRGSGAWETMPAFLYVDASPFRPLGHFLCWNATILLYKANEGRSALTKALPMPTPKRADSMRTFVGESAFLFYRPLERYRRPESHPRPTKRNCRGQRRRSSGERGNTGLIRNQRCRFSLRGVGYVLQSDKDHGRMDGSQPLGALGQAGNTGQARRAGLLRGFPAGHAWGDFS